MIGTHPRHCRARTQPLETINLFSLRLPFVSPAFFVRLVSLPLFFFFFFFSPPPVTGLPSRSGHRRGVARSGLVYNCIIYSAIWPTVNLYNFPVAVYVNSTNPLCRLAHRAAFEYRGQQRGRLFPPGAAPGGLFREISHR